MLVVAAAAVMLTCMYGSVGAYAALPTPWTTGQSISYTILTRPAWSIALATVLFFCFTQQGGLLQKILGAPGWEPAAKLSYAAFLLHPMVTQVCSYTSTQLLRYSGINLAVGYVATLVFSYAAAALEKCVLPSALPFSIGTSSA